MPPTSAHHQLSGITQIQRLAAAARAHGAEHVLLAGDTFDSATPLPQVLRQALAAMRDESEVTCWLLGTGIARGLLQRQAHRLPRRPGRTRPTRSSGEPARQIRTRLTKGMVAAFFVTIRRVPRLCGLDGALRFVRWFPVPREQFVQA